MMAWHGRWCKCALCLRLAVVARLLAHHASAAQVPRPPFKWGLGTAAFLVEGGNDVKGDSIWDTYYPHAPFYLGDPDEHVDFYHRYHDDTAMLERLGVQQYRISVSWPRIFPNNTGVASAVGLKFYTDVVDALVNAGIAPFITLYVWDTPQWVQDATAGFADETDAFNQLFLKYAHTVFSALGDRVKHWITFNEPTGFCYGGFGGNGTTPPNRCSDRAMCAAGNSTTEPLRCLYNVVRAHGLAAQALRALVPSGRIGLQSACIYKEPLTDSQADREAANTSMHLEFGMVMDPLYFGLWPDAVTDPNTGRNRAGLETLPQLTDEDKRLLAGSIDFFGVNYYTSSYQSATAGTTQFKEGVAIGRNVSGWQYVVPWGLRKLLSWLHANYNGTEVIITEFGVVIPDEWNKGYPAMLHDNERVQFFQDHVAAAAQAVQDGVSVSGFHAWTLFDNYKLVMGFSMAWVDYDGSLRREPKASLIYMATLFNGTLEA